MTTLSRAVTVGFAFAIQLLPRMAQTQMSPQELHDRIVAVYAPRAQRPLPSGDTLISWYGNPVLFHTVRRAANETATGMLRADSLLGTAIITWRNNRPASGEVRWTKGDSVEVDVHLAVEADSLRGGGVEPRAWPLPKLPWAIADYGMEDLILPLLESLQLGGGEVTIAAYRPYGAKWDTLQVTKRPVGDGVLYELRGSDGKRDWWLVSRTGALVQLRREGQNLERRPLEQTALFDEYRRLSALLKQ